MRILLGLLLLTAAMLKMAGGSGQVMHVALPFLSPRLYAAGVALEAVLGVWLLSGVAPAWSWLSSVGFFALLGVVSLRLGVLGEASCGCAGRLPLSPWWAFGIDAAALAALLVTRPPQVIAGLRRGVPVLAGAGLLVAFALGSLTIHYGSAAAAFAHIRSEPITVSPASVDVGTGEAGQSVSFNLYLTNHTAGPVRIIGGTSDCSCVATDDVPVVIPPKEERTIRVRVTLFKGTPGVFRREFVLYAEVETLSVLPVSVTGRIVEAQLNPRSVVGAE